MYNSNGSVPHSISIVSFHPSLSSSSSIMSGIPSKSLSKYSADTVRLNISIWTELLAEIENMVSLNAINGAPDIIPFVKLNISPSGIRGAIVQFVTFPPNISGSRYISSNSIIRSTSSSRYNKSK